MGVLKSAYYLLGCLVFLVILLMAWWAYSRGLPSFGARLTALEEWITARVSGPLRQRARI
jgi:hypothetical protein